MSNKMRCGRFYTDVVAAATMNFPAGDMQKEKATQDAARRQKETLENSANEKSARKLKSTKTAEHTASFHLPLPLSLYPSLCLPHLDAEISPN